MSQMLPEGAEVMRRVACGDVCPAPAPAPSLAPPLHHQLQPANRSSENKELLRQQLLSSSKERLEKSEPPKQKLARNRQKNRWKLKFHHQALPQEYLDHYEQSLQRANAKQVQVQQKQKPPEKPKAEPTFDINNFTNETFKIWAQRLAGLQSEVPAPAAMQARPTPRDDKKKKNPAIAPSKIVTYDDLPYMGEMTLNNSKPRRGRKPKKADICHLIYENYGTVVPGQPQPDRPPRDAPRSPADPPRTDLQNKIISSLLERKLSQNKRRLESRVTSPHSPPPAAPPTRAGPLHRDHEPLNLCVRDLRDLKIRIRRKFGDIYSSPERELADPGPPASEQPNAISVIQRNTNLPPSGRSSPELSLRSASPAGSEPAGAGGWGPAGLYVHPLALQTQLLYYRRLAAAGGLPLPLPASPSPGAASSPATSTGEPPSAASSPLDEPDGRSKLVLKQISELLDPKVIEREAERSPEPRAKRASPDPARGPAKRKRSAIFIPPIPPKTGSSTPTTEVSICKFKFTGGSKPSLQEKKMLSVDSGGNFRYYSGTGTKGNKGYDYLRDAGRARPAGESPAPAPAPPEEVPGAASADPGKKKRKSRKSLQREKLEQTFKEKGFLIQTQQLQSAEGATYCKFRQLRKFTRYLFRSWKDYLPGELEERAGGEAPGHAPDREGAAGEWG